MSKPVENETKLPSEAKQHENGPKTPTKRKIEFTKLRLPCIAKGGLHLTPLLGSTLDESSFMSEPM